MVVAGPGNITPQLHTIVVDSLDIQAGGGQQLRRVLSGGHGREIDGRDSNGGDGWPGESVCNDVSFSFDVSDIIRELCHIR